MGNIKLLKSHHDGTLEKSSLFMLPEIGEHCGEGFTDKNKIRYKHFDININSRFVKCWENCVCIHPLEFDLLIMFIHNIWGILSRCEIQDNVWGTQMTYNLYRIL